MTRITLRKSFTFPNASTDELIGTGKRRMTMQPCHCQTDNMSTVGESLREREKELNCLIEFSSVITKIATLPEILRAVTQLIPPACVFPERTTATIWLHGQQYGPNQDSTEGVCFEVHISVHGHNQGLLRVTVADGADAADSVILPEERRLIGAIAERLGRVIERKQAEQDLIVKDRAIASSLAGIILTDPDGIITHANPAAERLWKVPADQLQGQTIACLWAGHENTDLIRQQLQSEGCWSGELNAHLADGSNFTAQAVVSILHDDNGTPLGQNWSIADITERRRYREHIENSRRVLDQRVQERTARLTRINDQLIDQLVARKRAEQALRQSDQRYRLLLEQTNAAILHCNEEATVLLANRRLKSDCNLEPDQVIGRHIVEVFDSAEAELYQEKINEALRSGQGVTCEHQVERRTGQRWLTTNIHPVWDHDGNQGGVWVISHDITERRLATDQLKQANEQLRAERHALTEKNMALTAIMDQIDQRADKVAMQIETNIQRIVLPLLDKLAAKTDSQVTEYVQMIRTQLADVTSPFIHNLERQFSALTPREVEICAMIRNGMSCKEIGDHLNASDRTVLKHRQNVRRKLGLSQTKTNLATFLRQMTSLR
jgi:PAS domain S-box-containing protein